MIYSGSVLSELEVEDIASTFDDVNHSVSWLFRDRDGDQFFVHYTKYLDETLTDFHPTVDRLFNKFCVKSGLEEKTILASRLSVFVQEEEKRFIIPERATDSKGVFLYFVTDTDRDIEIEGIVVRPTKGSGVFTNGNYRLVPPHYDNFFTIIEVEYN